MRNKAGTYQFCLSWDLADSHGVSDVKIKQMSVENRECVENERRKRVKQKSVFGGVSEKLFSGAVDVEKPADQC